MLKKLLVAFAVLAIAPFLLAACGDDDEGDTGEATTEATTTEATEDTTATDDTGGGGGGATVEISADPGGDLAYEEDSVSAPAGDVTIAFTNESSLPHDVRVESSDGEDLGGTEVVTGGETEASVSLEAGDYTFYCSVPGHREAGMEGTLTAE